MPKAPRALAACAAIAAVAILPGCGQGDMPNDSPGGTVRDFLVNAVVDDYGFGACRFLTRHARLEVSAVEPPDVSCRDAFATGTLLLGRDDIDTEAKVKRLDYQVEQDGDRARVTVRADGAARTFELRKGSPAELREFSGPRTSWRIDSGVAALLEPGGGGG